MNLRSARVFVRDLEEAAQLLLLGVRFCGEPEEQYWGGWLGTFLDRPAMRCNLSSRQPEESQIHAVRSLLPAVPLDVRSHGDERVKCSRLHG